MTNNTKDMNRKYFLSGALVLMSCLGASAQSGNSLIGDVNGDGHVDAADITEVVNVIMSNSDQQDVEITEQRNWGELMRLPSREEIDNYNSTSTERSPYIGAWFDTDSEKRFTMFSVDFKADYLPPATYCSIANFYMDYSSLEEQGIQVTPTSPDNSISGYAGFQRNGEDPLRYNSIMSIWERKCEKGDEEEIVNAKLVKPDGAHENVFTHEGNGVNYMPAFSWRAHKWYRMLLVCVDSETTGNTIVEQWLYDFAKNSWTKICAYDMGLPNLTFKGQTCVFLENFDKKYSGEIRTLEFKNARVYNHEKKKWIKIESAYLFKQFDWPGSYQFGTDGSTYWIITTGVPNCAESQKDVKLYVQGSESGKPY